MGYYVSMALLGAVIICFNDDLNFNDALFLSVGGITSSGLSTISMANLSWFSLFVMAVLMSFGQLSVVILFITLYRIKKFKIVNQSIQQSRRTQLIPEYDQLDAKEKEIIAQQHLLFDSLALLSKVLFFYIIICQMIFGLMLLLSLYLYPNQPELEARGFSRIDNAVYLTISAYSNSGYSISSDSLIGLQFNPMAYITLSILILLGNTMMPIILRLIITHLSVSRDPTIHRPAKYILNHPHSVVHGILYDENDTILLFQGIIGLNIFQYVVFLIFSLNNDRIPDYLSDSTLAGLGYFQAISTRCAGFNILDLRTLNQGVIYVYCVFCYLTADKIVRMFKGNSIDEVIFHDGHKTKPLVKMTEDVINPIQPAVEDNPINGQENFKYRYIPQAISRHESKDNSFITTSINQDENDDVMQPKEVNPNQVVWKYFYLSDTIKNNHTRIFNHTNILMLACLVLAFTEDRILWDSSIDVNLWFVIFEIVSGYGGVGLSMGALNESYSLSGMFSPVGKLVITFVCLLGKHRGLPRETDESIDFLWEQILLASRLSVEGGSRRNSDDSGAELVIR